MSSRVAAGRIDQFHYKLTYQQLLLNLCTNVRCFSSTNIGSDVPSICPTMKFVVNCAVLLIAVTLRATLERFNPVTLLFCVGEVTEWVTRISCRASLSLISMLTNP